MGYFIRNHDCRFESYSPDQSGDSQMAKTMVSKSLSLVPFCSNNSSCVVLCKSYITINDKVMGSSPIPTAMLVSSMVERKKYFCSPFPQDFKMKLENLI